MKQIHLHAYKYTCTHVDTYVVIEIYMYKDILRYIQMCVSIERWSEIINTMLL